jgi:hypothetical protein
MLHSHLHGGIRYVQLPSSVLYSDLLLPDPDPGWITDPDSIRIQDFADQKLKKKLPLKKMWYFFQNYIFKSKRAIYLFLGLPKERPSYRKSLQPSQKHSALQNIKFLNFFLFVGHFCPPGSGSTELIESGSETQLIALSASETSLLVHAWVPVFHLKSFHMHSSFKPGNWFLLCMIVGIFFSVPHPPALFRAFSYISVLCIRIWGSAWCSLLRAEGFFCSFDFLLGGLRISNTK